MQPGWIALIKETLAQIADFRRYWKLVTGFISKVSTIPEAKEAKRIENTEKYLIALAKQLSAMKKMGTPDEELRQLAESLGVPLLQANLEAMVIARQLSAPRPSQNPEQPEDRP